MKKIHAMINGIPVEVPYVYTILQAAEEVGIEIPTLCHLKHMAGDGSCRICVVEVWSKRKMVAACSTRIMEGDVIYTESEPVIESRKGVLDLLLSYHTKDCDHCEKNRDCKLQEYCERYEITESSFENPEPQLPVNDFNSHFTYDANRCILCHRCMNVCHRKVGRGAIDLTLPGAKTLVSAVFNMDWSDGYCESCGNCVSACPVGALVSKTRRPHGRDEVTRVRTTCGRCGMGCQMELLVKEDEIVDVMPFYGAENHGLLCAKGKFGYGEDGQADRIRTPMVRNAAGELTACSWDEALDVVAGQTLKVRAESDVDEIAGLASPSLLNEDLYLFQKFLRVAGETALVDYVGSRNRALAESGFRSALGFHDMMSPIKDVSKAEVILVVCSERDSCQPVVDMQIRRAVRQGARLIVIDAKGTEFADIADYHLMIRPGTLVALMNGMMQVLFQNLNIDREFVHNHTEGVDELRACVMNYTPETVGKICGLRKDLIIQAAELFGKTQKSYIAWQYASASKGDDALAAMSVSTLAMLSGNLGKRGCGLNMLSYVCNEQGCLDMGVAPELLPGRRELSDFRAGIRIQRTWNKILKEEKGRYAKDWVPGLQKGRIRLLYLCGDEDEAWTQTLCDVTALDPEVFLVVQASRWSEWAKRADVVLPSTSFGEEDGTYTNMERKVQRVRKALSVKGDARPGWQIINSLMNRMGFASAYESAEAVLQEIGMVAAGYEEISWERLSGEPAGIYAIPVKEIHKEGRTLLGDLKKREGHFAVMRGCEWQASAGKACQEYPIMLMSYPVNYYYRKIDMLSMGRGMFHNSREGWMELNGDDARRLGIVHGEEVLVKHAEGSFSCFVRLVDSLPMGIAWMPEEYHKNLDCWETMETEYVLPEYKQVRIRIEKRI